MKKLIKPLLPLCAILLASCGADDEIVTPDNQVPVNNSTKKMSFSASIKEDVTRAKFDEQNKTVWSDNDKIWVYNAAVSTTSNIQHFTLTKGSGTKNAEFEGEQIDHNEGKDANDFYAFYPYDAKNTVTFNGNTVATSLPSVQAAKENLFETGYQYMTAYTKNSNLSFRNIVSFFKVKVKSSSTFQVSRIKIVANNVTQEDGTASDKYTKTFLNIAGDFSAEIGDNGKASNITVTDNASNVVETTITPDSTEEKTYYLAVLPTTDNLKFTLLLESEFDDDNGQKIYQATNSGLPFEAGKIYELGPYDASKLERENKVLDNVVDLDLPSGTIWATTNLGASAPTEMGDFYKWGRLEAYTTGGYNANNGDFTQYDADDEPAELAMEHDVVYQKYPSENSPLKGKFAMPNKDQAKELTVGGYVNVPDLEKNSTNANPEPYYTVYSINKPEHYIVFPTGGRKTNTSTYDNESKASYWSKVRVIGNANADYNKEGYWYDFRPATNTGNNSKTITGMTAFTRGTGDGTYNRVDSYNYGRQIRGVVLNKNVAPASAYPGN